MSQRKSKDPWSHCGGLTHTLQKTNFNDLLFKLISTYKAKEEALLFPLFFLDNTRNTEAPGGTSRRVAGASVGDTDHPHFFPDTAL